MKKSFLIFFSVISFVAVIVYLASCLTPLFGAANWWLFGFLGLGFPFLFLGMLLLIFIWMWIDKKIAFILSICVLLGFNNIKSFFAWHFTTKEFSVSKAQGVVRIMGYNVRSFDNFDCSTDTVLAAPNNRNRMKIFDYILNNDVDILCLQDFNEYYRNQYFPSNIGYLKNKLHFDYSYISPDNNQMTPSGFCQNGVALVSKYPLKNIQVITYPEKKRPECFIIADITINNITRRVLVTHLQSMWLNNGTNNPPKWDKSDDAQLNYSQISKFEKLKYYLPYHAKQADCLRREINKSPYPMILSLDMNEVPNSYCYHQIRGNLNDAFLKIGFGLGTTYPKICPTLRIDYLFTDPSIDIVQYKRDKVLMSDHYPQVMDVKW